MSYFVYLLFANASSGQQTYVGATVDLDHRLRQHNKEIKGGAHATGSKVAKGESWRRHCYVSGFPNWQAALQFEWRWKQISRKLPIKMLVFNNNAYGANFITQNLYFKSLFGTNAESGLSFPNTEKIANAYGIKYMSIKKNSELNDVFTTFLNSNEAVICEVFCTIQQRNPKLSSVKNDDGTFSSRPFEDMEPFLDREVFKKEMIVTLI